MQATADGTTVAFRWNGYAIARAWAIAGLVTVVVASFGPWLRSGARVRSSYELFEVVDRLGFLGAGALRWAPRMWVCVPLLAAVALALFVAGRPRMAAALTAAVGGFVLVVGSAALNAPLPAEWGSRAGALGGALSLTSATAVIATSTSSRGTGS